MTALERAAVARVITEAEASGVDIPDAVRAIAHHLNGHHGSAGARLYADTHPDGTTGVPDGMLGCCWGSAMGGLAACTCWTPVYDVDQAAPDTSAVHGTMPAKCSDCAFRPGSPERSDPWLSEALYDLPAQNSPFWCHDGMRRPARWTHPAGVTVEGDPADWTPPIVDGRPYRADGRPGDLCAGWAAIRAAHDRDGGVQ